MYLYAAMIQHHLWSFVLSDIRQFRLEFENGMLFLTGKHKIARN